MTNAQQLIDSLGAVTQNIQGEPIAELSMGREVGQFIVRQSLKISLGVPCVETTLHDTETGCLVYTARDEEGLARAQGSFNDLQYRCSKMAVRAAKQKTRQVVDIIGFLGC